MVINSKLKLLIVAVIFLVATFLRFYKLEDYALFLGDQGRDVLIVKRMIVDHKWTLLGPSASVGGFFTGPIYYYFMIPFLWFFMLNPVGPIVMSALFGLGTCILLFVLMKKFVSFGGAIVSVALAAISPELIYISRFSWNPNPVPFFTLALISLIYLYSTTKKWVYSILIGLCLGILFQLHYTDLILGPFVAVALFITVPFAKFVKSVVGLGVGVVLSLSFFLAFEIRHNFVNLMSVTEFITRRGGAVEFRFTDFLSSVWSMSSRVYETMFAIDPRFAALVILVSILGFILWTVSIKRDANKFLFNKIVLSWLVVGILGISMYHGNLVAHYFSYLFMLPFILIGGAWEYYKRSFFGLILISATVVYLGAICVQNLFLWRNPGNMIKNTINIDRTVSDLVGNEPYNFALISDNNTDHAYIYFLELWHKSPVIIENPSLDPLRKTVTKQLIVVCESDPCKPLGHPLWEIAGFGSAQIEKEVEGPAGIKILRLIRYNNK